MIKIPKNYQAKLSLIQTEEAIKFIKDNFESKLAQNLKLIRVSAPVFLDPDLTLNDELNGLENPVSFKVTNNNKKLEIIQSLAKRKRNALKKYNCNEHEGIYADMNAIRKNETLDNIHSIYVDQRDWEKIVLKDDRNLEYLFKIVKIIYQIIQEIEHAVNTKYSVFTEKLPQNITFISTSELEKRYPNKSRKERENLITKKFKAVFLYQIGWPLKDGLPHDGRAADYDDWNYNGDILVYNPILKEVLEISSMGIRVDENSIIKQLEFKNETKKIYTPYCQNIINKSLPYTIGGGIGQSRLCLFFLEKAHIGEVQASYWDKEDIENAKENNINLL